MKKADYKVEDVFSELEIEINDSEWLEKMTGKVNELLNLECNAGVRECFGALIRAKDVAQYILNSEYLGKPVRQSCYFL